MRTPLRLIIADDHALFRQGLRSLLQLEGHRSGRRSRIGGRRRGRRLGNRCDVLLLDLQMERCSMDEIAELARLTKVIVLTANESAEMACRALRLGAKGVVQKRFAIETLMTAIRTVADGLVWMPPTMQAELARQESSERQGTDPARIGNRALRGGRDCAISKSRAAVDQREHRQNSSQQDFPEARRARSSRAHALRDQDRTGRARSRTASLLTLRLSKCAAR